MNLDFDYHIHTNFSDASMSFEEILSLLFSNGIKSCGITDHFEIGHKNSVRTPLKKYLSCFYTFKEKALARGITVYMGCETGMDEEGLLLPPIPRDVEYIIASLHRLLAPPTTEKEYWERYKKIIQLNVSRGGFNILGHVEGYLPVSPFLTEEFTFEERREFERYLVNKYFCLDWYTKLAKSLREQKIAVEIHEPTSSPRLEVLDLLKRKGVLFSYGTDSHLPAQIEVRRYLKTVVRELNLDARHFLNLRNGGNVDYQVLFIDDKGGIL